MSTSNEDKKDYEKSQEKTKQNKMQVLSNSINIKKEKKKKNRKKKIEKNTKSKNNLSKDNNILGSGILSEIKQISIPSILSEKEDLFKILQSEIINIDKSLSLLNKKKKYYNEIIQKLINDIQNEKKNIKKNEIKNKEYLFLENILQDFDLNDIFDNCDYIGNNSYYNINKIINNTLDYNYLSLNEKNKKNYLVINFCDEKNKNNTINKKMEPNYQLSYEEFNNIDDLDDNFCLLISKEKEKNNIIENISNSNNNNKEDLENKANDLINNDDNKIICEEEEYLNNNINKKGKDISNTPFKNKINEERDGEFEVIDEAPPEEEETTYKNRKKIDIENVKDIKIKNDNYYQYEKKDLQVIDKNINKNYSNNLEELDFYLLKDSRKKEIKENKKKKITVDDIQKKYKTQEMGSDFIVKENDISSYEENSPEENSSQEEEKEQEKIKNRKKKKNNIKDINFNSNKNKEEEKSNVDNEYESKNENDYSDNIEISKNIDDDGNSNKKKKKRYRKKKKKEEKIFSLEEELPDPENLDNVALALEMKKYGMKPQNKKRNIEILKSVYKFLKIKELPENISRKLSSFDLDMDKNNTDSEKDNNIRNKNHEDISNIAELSDEQKKNIIDIIKEDKIIYEKILLFKEISLKEIKSLLNSKGIIVANHLLSQLLINSGVILPGGWNDKK